MVPEKSIRIATIKRVKCLGLKYSMVASTIQTFTDLLDPPGQSRVVNRNMEITTLRSLLYESSISVFSVVTGFLLPMIRETLGENLLSAITDATRKNTYVGNANLSHVLRYAFKPLIKQPSNPDSRLSHATTICGNANASGSEVLRTILA